MPFRMAKTAIFRTFASRFKLSITRRFLTSYMSVEINEVVLPVNSGYGADSIQVLEGLEAVRKTPRHVYRRYRC
jgi:hypothetical protein